MAVKPKTFKIVVPGEIIKLIEEHTFQDGTKVVIQTMVPMVVPSKKNQQRIVVNKATFKPSLLPSEQHEKWKANQFKVFTRAADGMAAAGYSLPIARAKVKVLFYFPDRKDRDLSNKFETIADIMVDAGIILDDRFKVLKPINLDGWVNRAKPRTEIYLTLITGDMEEYNWDLTPAEYEIKRLEQLKLKRRVKISKRKKAAQSAAISSILSSLLLSHQ